MKTEILIVTHAKDVEFLRYCLASIKKYASGFAGITLVVPRHQAGHFAWASSLASVKLFEEPTGRGMLAHMAQICCADQWCPAADLVLHIDADCMFWKPATPADFMRDGKPVLVRERYADCWKSNGARTLWQKAVERATGFKPEWETMVRQGAMHVRDVYPAVRDAVSAHTGRPFYEHVLDGPNTFPQEFCEFGTLGAIAIRDFACRYSFLDYDHDADARECAVSKPFQYVYRKKRDALVEYWSHGGIATYRTVADAILRGETPEFYVK